MESTNSSNKMETTHRTAWTPGEDAAIAELVNELGNKNWKVIAEQLRDRYTISTRSGKQCRERWYNHLNPSVNKGAWTDGETLELYRLHRRYGNRWAIIAKELPGRTDNAIKNHLYSNVRKFVKVYNKNKPARERILRTTKSLIRDRGITRDLLKFYGKEASESEEIEENGLGSEQLSWYGPDPQQYAEYCQMMYYCWVGMAHWHGGYY